ncbi:MAG: glycoside hydrolase family 16 protein [Salinimicrobium sp.]
MTIIKKIINNILILFMLTGLVACEQDKQAWDLVWSDEFNYQGLPDESKWSYDTAGNAWGWGNHEAQFYTERDSLNSYVSDGTLKIRAVRKDMGGKKYTSARLITEGKGDWKYGKVEVKAKLPEGKGTWPAIWMLSSDASLKWPDRGEIDIMEHVGFDPDTVFSTVHTKDFNHILGTQVGKKMYLPTATSKFHVYTLEWEENEIRSQVDGKEYFTYKNENNGVGAWPFDKSFYLLLNLAIGGGLGGQQGIDNNAFPHTFEIDYVRVYQKI